MMNHSTINNVEPVLCEMFAWADNTIVLHWIKEDPRRFKTYYTNKIQELKSPGTISSTGQLISLSPLLDLNGILQVGGR